jgi:TPP-dependent indolepyruvate ferredoxin oxidoreductase alpha subunit
MCGGTYQEVIELQITMKDLVLVQEEHCSCCVKCHSKFECVAQRFGIQSNLQVVSSSTTR